MTGAKPLYRFRDRALAGLMAARGWIAAVIVAAYAADEPPEY